jgi:phytoene desaturase
MPEAVVIGGGFGGIAASLRLRAKGYSVALFDRCERLGGRAQVFERDGFRHDAGPTVLTAPFLFEELFELFDRRLADYVSLVPVEPWYRFEFPGGERLDYGGSLEQTLAEIARFEPRDVDGYLNLLEQSRRIFDVGFRDLADQPFDSAWTMARQVPSLLRLGCYRTVWQMVSRHLRDPRLRQAFSIQPLLVGGNPFDTTSIYSLIHYLEREWGVHFAMGGTGALVEAFGRLMREVGIDVRLGSTVRRILVDGDEAKAIELEDGQHVPADVVVSNADPVHLYGSMLEEEHQSLTARVKRRRAQLSMGLFVLYFGTRRQYTDVAHHTIWLGRRYKGLLRDIFHGRALPEDFSLYVHRPTATDPSFAPPGCDSFYVLAPVPNLTADIDWSVEGPRLRQRIIDALDRSMLPGLKQCITGDFHMTPEDFAGDYLSAGGAGFSVAPLFRQSAWFRFHNRAEGPRNLYLVGAGTHPGAGLPGVLSSAKVLERLIPDVEGAASWPRLQAGAA